MGGGAWILEQASEAIQSNPDQSRPIQTKNILRQHFCSWRLADSCAAIGTYPNLCARIRTLKLVQHDFSLIVALQLRTREMRFFGSAEMAIFGNMT